MVLTTGAIGWNCDYESDSMSSQSSGVENRNRPKIAAYPMRSRYENIPVVKSGDKSKATLPVKPMMLPRNMGVWSVYPSDDIENEFIPLQMGQSSLLRSQLLINDLLGQVGYEVRGLDVYFTKDITKPQGTTVDIEMAIMDISNYGDYDILPVPPEMEWTIVQEVFKLYMAQPLADKVVSSTAKEEKGTPIRQQNQS